MGNKWVPKEDIEARAIALLEEYASAHGPVTEPPVPVEQILEEHLGYTMGFGDLTAELGTDGVVAGMNFEEREVIIDVSLDPTTAPDSTGRMRYSVAHEIWHVLDEREGGNVRPPARAFRLNRRTGKDPDEWRADYFASCLLMPEFLVRAAWPAAEQRVRERRGEYGPSDEVLERPDPPPPELGPRTILLWQTANRLAEVFDTSEQAAGIRSTELYHRWGGWDGRPVVQAALSEQGNGKG